MTCLERALVWVVCASAVCSGCGTPVLWVGRADADAATESPAPRSDAKSPVLPDASTPAAPPPEAQTAALSAGAPAAPASSGSSLSSGALPPTAATANALAHGAPPPAADADADADADAGVPASALRRPALLPNPEGRCPALTGDGMYTFSAGGRSLLARVFMRPDARRMPAPGGPLIMFFHSVGTDSSQVFEGLGQPAIDAVVAQGGMVAAFNASPCLRCGFADDVVWYDQDDVISDQLVACAVDQAQIDTRRIHSVGFSAGALHSMHLLLARSNFIASVVSYSGGTPSSAPAPQDPDNTAPALLSFGARGVDNALLDFNEASHDWYDRYAPRGHYVLMCDHGGGHMIPSELAPHALRFLLDHPYRAEPEPYLKGVPSQLPSYCR